MKRIYHHYEKWEDWKAGMYLNADQDKIEWFIQQATKILSDSTLCEKEMNKVIEQWKNSCEHNLTDLGSNRRAWLGQAACCITYKVPENLTRIAWNLLDEQVQKRANKIAEKIIEKWELSNKNTYAKDLFAN